MKQIYLIGLCLSLAACASHEEKGTESIKVKVVEVKNSVQSTERSYSFIARPYRTADLSFRVGGPIHRFDVQSGQFFRKGEVIAAIDDRDFLIRKERMEAVYDQAKSDYHRISNLYEKGNISATSYEQAKANYEKAKADYRTAVNELNDTRLTAPFDGYVQQVYAERFQDVRASAPIVSFIDISRIKAEAYIPEGMAAQMRRTKDASACKVTFDMLDGQTFTPSETYLTQSASDNNISFLYTVVIDNKDNSLLGGMTGKIILDNLFHLHSFTSVSIPQTAVGHNPEKGAFVWKVNDDATVTQVPVQLGNIGKDNNIEVLSGLQPGERIAGTRISQLSENDKISL